MAQVGQAGLKAGDQEGFIVGYESAVPSVRRADHGEAQRRSSILSREGLRWAEISSEGALKVVIEIDYRGHAGEFGFAYSDKPLFTRAIRRRTRREWEVFLTVVREPRKGGDRDRAVRVRGPL